MRAARLGLGGKDGGGRLLWLDMARTVAVLGMVVFHFARNLETFAVVPPGLTQTGGWAVFARMVASSFLFLSGMGLVIAHGGGLGIGPWARRLAVIVAAAALVSVATWAAMPQVWVFFGILHAIALASILGVAFLRAPAIVTGLTAVAVLVIHWQVGRSLDLPLWLVWTGLTEKVPRTLDFVPVVPYFAAFLAGMTFAKAVPPDRLEPNWRSRPPRLLTWPGQHSLFVYLVHQPVLIALIAAAVWLVG